MSIPLSHPLSIFCLVIYHLVWCCNQYFAKNLHTIPPVYIYLEYNSLSFWLLNVFNLWSPVLLWSINKLIFVAIHFLWLHVYIGFLILACTKFCISSTVKVTDLSSVSGESSFTVKAKHYNTDALIKQVSLVFLVPQESLPRMLSDMLGSLQEHPLSSCF